MCSDEQYCFYIQSKYLGSQQKKMSFSLLFSKLSCSPFRQFYFLFILHCSLIINYNVTTACSLCLSIEHEMVLPSMCSGDPVCCEDWTKEFIAEHYNVSLFLLECSVQLFTQVPTKDFGLSGGKKLENSFVNVTQRNLHQLSICNGEKKRYLNLTVGPARCLES